MNAARAKARNLDGDFTGGRLDFYASVASVYSMVKAFPMSLPSVIILCPKEFKFTDATASIETPHLAGVANLQWLFTGTFFVGVPDVTTLPLLMFTASVAGNYQIAAITALILLIPSVGFMLFVERFLKADVLAKVGS